jgi:histidine decarboxylase
VSRFISPQGKEIIMTDEERRGRVDPPPADPAANPNVPYGPEGRPWRELVPAGAAVTSPSVDPISVYPRIPPANVVGRFPRIDYRLFEIPPTGLTADQRAKALRALKRFASTQHARFTGFQANQGERYASDLAWMMDMHANNVGDPFETGLCTLNTKFCERAVVDHFAALWNNRWPHRPDVPGDRHPDSQWGYVLSMGSTEANVYGLFNARDYLKGRSLIEDPESTPGTRFLYADPLPEDNPNAYKPIVFYSQDTHYSVIKAVRILELTTFYEEGRKRFPGQCPITENGEWLEEVPSHNPDNEGSGTIDVDALKELVHFFVERGYPPLIVLNFGSTWKGAYDDVPAVNTMLTDLRYEFPWLWDRRVRYDEDHPRLFDRRRGFWLHIDGALGAGYMPYLEMAYNRGLIGERGPIFDFRNESVMSICCSMHKWFGAPWPGSVYMTRIGYQLAPPDTAGYIGSADTTLGGSRNAFSAVIFWDYLARHGYEKSMNEVLRCLDDAAYLEQRLQELEAKLNADKPQEHVDLWIARSRLSLAVRFRLLNPSISWKYTVDSERLWVPISPTEEQERTYSHVYVMQSVDRGLIDALLKDVEDACEGDWHDAFPAYDGAQPNPGDTRPYVPPVRGKENQILMVPHQGRGLGAFVHPSKRAEARGSRARR